MGIFEKHLGKGEEIDIEGTKFLLKPLTTESIPDLMKVMKMFSGTKEGGNVEDMFKNLNDDGLGAVKKLIDNTLKISFPDEPEVERGQFGMKYMMILLPKIFEINSSDMGSHETKKKAKILEHINKKQ